MAFCVRGELFLFRQTSSWLERGGAEGQRGEKGARGGGVVGWLLSERAKACSQTVGVGFALPFIHTGAYNLQRVINHCCVWG